MKYINLTQGKQAIVDDGDYEMLMLNKYKWHVEKWRRVFYAVSRIKKEVISMHRLLLGYFPKGYQTDHINGDGLDNRRCNLRKVTIRENGQNRHHPKSSQYPGVSWRKDIKKWSSKIRINGRKRHLGCFENEQEAANIYKKFALEQN